MNNERSIHWALVLYPNEDPTHKSALDFIKENYSKYAFIKHDKDFLEDNSLCISVTADVRIVYISNGKIYSKANRQEYVMKKLNVDVVDLKEGANLIKCSNCGAPININDGICSYCRNTIKYLQEWILVEKKDN